jgi:hypothetical protein
MVYERISNRQRLLASICPCFPSHQQTKLRKQCRSRYVGLNGDGEVYGKVDTTRKRLTGNQIDCCCD